PRKNRRKAYNETLSEKKVVCLKEMQVCTGHNKTTCPGGAIGSNPKRKSSTSEEGELRFNPNHHHKLEVLVVLCLQLKAKKNYDSAVVCYEDLLKTSFG
ncbi:hypothetical protein MKW92_033775, partial [Papaver armeniacum]